MNSTKNVFPVLHNPNLSCDLNEIRSLAVNDQKISLIKEYRYISGYGLKDSKDAIEGCYGIGGYDLDKLEELFKQHLEASDPFTKEEFMHILSDAIDHMDSFYFKDMLEAVMVTCKNIKDKGGLEYLEKKRDEFLNAI